MDFRLADKADLPQLKAVYGKIIYNMNKNNIQIWDEIYPCEIFPNDVENGCLYVMTENDEIVSAFALYSSNAGKDYVEWENKQSKALYMDRFGVNVNYLRNGAGSKALGFAVEIAKEKGAEYLRLFVVDINKAAINFYIKNGFERAQGIYEERIDDDLILHEFGFELKI